jgi:hypothetical protein
MKKVDVRIRDGKVHFRAFFKVLYLTGNFLTMPSGIILPTRGVSFSNAIMLGGQLLEINPSLLFQSHC